MHDPQISPNLVADLDEQQRITRVAAQLRAVADALEAGEPVGVFMVIGRDGSAILNGCAHGWSLGLLEGVLQYATHGLQVYRQRNEGVAGEA